MRLYICQHPKLHAVRCYNTSPPAEGEVFLPLGMTPTAQAPAPRLPPVTYGVGPGARAAWWLGSTGGGRKEGKGDKVPSPSDGSEISSCQSHDACTFTHNFSFPVQWLVNQ